MVSPNKNTHEMAPAESCPAESLKTHKAAKALIDGGANLNVASKSGLLSCKWDSGWQQTKQHLLIMYFH